MTEFVDARKMAAMLNALADPTRLRVAFYLARGPHHVGQLAELLGVPIVNMSHHLGVMRTAGLLDDEKQGRRVLYSFRPGLLTAGDGNEVLATLAIGHLRVFLRSTPTDLPDGKMPTRTRTKARK
jgi:ArsR family transcriptional regulator